MGQATEFIRYLRKKSEQIPESVYEKAKDCLMDYLAVTWAGAEENRCRWEDTLRHSQEGAAPVIGCSLRVDGKTAALINGFNAHSLELDDGQRFAMIHLGGSIISALVSAGAEYGLSRADLLRGIVMGYEAACRLSIPMQPSHKKLGFHTAGTCGTVGAAMAVAFALNMEPEQMETVLASAAAGAAGLLEIQEQASELKPYNVGRAAMDGLTAAYMGNTGFRAPEDILNGERGFLRLFSQDCCLQKMTEHQEYFEIQRIYVKPYAACRHCHSAIEAALCLRQETEVSQIASVEIETYQLAVKGHDHTRISGTGSAKLSLPYSVAAALVLGRADVSAFAPEQLAREDIRALLPKITVKVSQAFTSVSGQKRIAKVTVHTKSGESLEKQVDYAKGDPENPMSRQEIIDKAYSLIGERAAALAQMCYTEQVKEK